jgi:hypothetical protein
MRQGEHFEEDLRKLLAALVVLPALEARSELGTWSRLEFLKSTDCIT